VAWVKTHDHHQPGGALAEYGRSILMVDFDPQGALSAGLGVNTHDEVTIYDLLIGREKGCSQSNTADQNTGDPHNSCQH